MEETLNAIRTVFAFGGESVEVDRYMKLLYPSAKAAKRKGLYSSISDGVTRFLFFVSCALSFYLGVSWVFRDRDRADKDYTPASLLIVSGFNCFVCDLQLISIKLIKIDNKIHILLLQINIQTNCLPF